MTEFGGIDHAIDPLEFDDVSSQDYQIAIQRLREFLEVPENSVATLEDVSSHCLFVGSDLRSIILGGGEIREHPLPPGLTINGSTVIRNYILENDTSDIVACAFLANRGQVAVVEIHKYLFPNETRQILQGSVPVYERIQSGRRIPGSVCPLGIESKNLGQENWNHEFYFPAKKPLDTSVQRGYLRCLQRGIRELIPVLENPVELSQAFNY